MRFRAMLGVVYDAASAMPPAAIPYAAAFRCRFASYIDAAVTYAAS